MDFLLTGGSQAAYRIGEAVLKKVHPRSLETEHSLALIPWLATELATISQEGFRLAQQVSSVDGRWLLDDNWAAWEFLDGEQAHASDIPAAIEAIRAMHKSLSHIEKNPLLDSNSTAWGVAHRHCWHRKSIRVHPVLADLVHQLYAKYRPLPDQPQQLIHGDLNPSNILVGLGITPGFIDFTPFWAPADFALAIFANWIGPRQGDCSVLKHFEDIPYFYQLLVRAAVRMLLIVSELEGVADWEKAPEKRAAELVLDLL